MGDCPVCNKHITEGSIEAHVNAHFEEEEPVRKKVRIESSDFLPPPTSTKIQKEGERNGKKCENCGVVVSESDWIRHSSVHDDEAIALALADTPPKPQLSRSNSTNFNNFEDEDKDTLHTKQQNFFPTSPTTYTNTNITNTTTSTASTESIPFDIDAETQSELDKFKMDKIRPAMIDIPDQLRKIYSKARSNTIQEAYLCGAVDHYASQRDDNGWGCGYRNIQNVCSFLMRFPMYKDRLFDGCGFVPSVQVLQMHLEEAWKKGYDKMGKDQLGRVAGTGKWIGTTECAALLRSFSVRCEIFDFHCNCCTKNTNLPNYIPHHLSKHLDHTHTHPRLMEWVYKYFTQNATSQVSLFGAKAQNSILSFVGSASTDKRKVDAMPCGPLYFQHQGHSRTIIGIERHKTGKYYMLVLDPSISEGGMTRAIQEQSFTAIKILRLPQEYFRHKRYQIARVAGVMDHDEQQKSKFVVSVSTIVSTE